MNIRLDSSIVDMRPLSLVCLLTLRTQRVVYILYIRKGEKHIRRRPASTPAPKPSKPPAPERVQTHVPSATGMDVSIGNSTTVYVSRRVSFVMGRGCERRIVSCVVSRDGRGCYGER